MADSKLKLQIVTALDAAGIKATKEQIDKMENALAKVNKNGSSSLGSLEQKLGKIPGPVGKIANMFEGLGGKVAKFGGIATLVIGTFKTGWDIGSWVNDKVVKPLFKIKDPIEELKKSNKNAAEGFDKLAEAVDNAADASARLQEKSAAALQKEIKDIEAASNAWQQAARSKIAYMTAGQDIETQMLERQRFEDVMRLQAAGDYEGAEQANKMYDVLNAELQAKQQIMKFDEETALIEKQVLDNDEKKVQLMKQAVAAQEAYNRKIAEREKFDKDTDKIVMTDAQYKQYQRRMRSYDRDIDKLKTAWEDAERIYENYDTGDNELATRQLQRMALVGRTSLATDQAALNYDQFMMQNGDRLGIQFTQQFKDTLTQTSKDSYDNLAKAVKDGVAEGIGLLMEVK